MLLSSRSGSGVGMLAPRARGKSVCRQVCAIFVSVRPRLYLSPPEFFDRARAQVEVGRPKKRSSSSSVSDTRHSAKRSTTSLSASGFAPSEAKRADDDAADSSRDALRERAGLLRLSPHLLYTLAPSPLLPSHHHISTSTCQRSREQPTKCQPPQVRIAASHFVTNWVRSVAPDPCRLPHEQWWARQVVRTCSLAYTLPPSAFLPFRSHCVDRSSPHRNADFRRAQRPPATALTSKLPDTLFSLFYSPCILTASFFATCTV